MEKKKKSGSILQTVINFIDPGTPPKKKTVKDDYGKEQQKQQEKMKKDEEKNIEKREKEEERQRQLKALVLKKKRKNEGKVLGFSAYVSLLEEEEVNEGMMSEIDIIGQDAATRAEFIKDAKEFLEQHAHDKSIATDKDALERLADMYFEEDGTKKK